MLRRGAFEGILDSVDKYERQQQLRLKQFEMWLGRNQQTSWAEFKQLNADFLAAEDEVGLGAPNGFLYANLRRAPPRRVPGLY